MRQEPELIDVENLNPSKFIDGDVEFTLTPSDGSELVDFSNEEEGEWSELGRSLGLDFDQSFSANLAEQLSPSQRRSIAQTLIEYHRVDLESRKDWDAMTRDALVALGVERIDRSNLPFEGAASIVHPVIAEAVVQFNSNAIEEFYPATGPVKGKAAGVSNADVEAQVERATDFMNYYLTVEDTGYFADSDQMLFYLPIAGSVFRKAWIDPRDGMPRARYVKADDFVAPYFARDLENCNRYCHQYQMTGAEIRRAMDGGEFLEIELPPPPLEAESSGQKMEDKADRRVRSLHQDDEVYELLEYHIDYKLPDGADFIAEELDRELPYIIVVDKTSSDILAVRRNWRERDQKMRKRIWFAHYKFLPGLGFYGWGFLHVLGQLGNAISGSVRALLDSALFATLQGGFRAKDGVKNTGSLAIEPGKWKDIDGTSEELAKTFYTPPAKEPSPALQTLYTALVQDARRFASITEVLVGTADNKAPVGTTLALIEQSMKLFTAIHKRIFNSAQQEFRMLAELFFEFGPDHYPYAVEGNANMAFKDDFDTETVDFIPVADPNIISDVQRLAIAQALLELMTAAPDLYPPEKRAEAHKAFIKALKVPDPERFEPVVPRATRLDPLGENMYMMTGKPVRAYPGQRHDLHRQVHRAMLAKAEATMPPDQFQQLYAIAMSHDREHQALEMYEQVSARMQQTMGMPLPPMDMYEAGEDMDPKLEMAISIAAAQNMPPPPPPEPGSVAAGSAEGGQDGPDKAAEQERQTAAKNAETHAGIERDTQAFVAEEKRKQEEHRLKLTREQEEFAAEQRRKDQETAAEILRANAKAKVDLQRQRITSALDIRHKEDSALQKTRHDTLSHASKLASQQRSDVQKLDTAKKSAAVSVAAKKKAAAAKPKPAAKKKAVH